jgi:peptidoglycan/LPS O-acetylase OafA/YrhL
MFFIHTSLVLMMSLDRLSKTSRAITTRFYIRRVFRIYPLSVVAVLILVAAHIPAYFEQRYTWLGVKVLCANLLLVQNLFHAGSVEGPLWSLPFEVQMYVLLPFLYRLTGKIRSNTLAAAGMIALGFAACFLDRRLTRLGGPVVLEYAPWFCMGVAAYALSRRVQPLLPARWYVVCLLVFVASPCVAHRVMASYRAGWAGWAAGILYAVTLPYFREITSPLCIRVAHIVAKYSYGIYLAHVPILWFAFQKLAGLPGYAQFMVFGALIAAIPAILYYSIEEPLIRVGARLSERIAEDSRITAEALVEA